MLIRFALITLAMPFLAVCAEEKSSPETELAELKVPFYYNVKEAQDVWGKADAIGLVFRTEKDQEVCHILFFGMGRDIVSEKVLAVVRKENKIVIGDVVCDWRPHDQAIVLPNSHVIYVDAESVVSTSLKESAKCRYLLTSYLTAEDLVGAEAKKVPKTDEETWKNLCGRKYTRIRSGDGSHGAGEGLYFLEDKDGRKCRVVNYGCGVPIVGEETVRVSLKGTQLAIGNRGFRIDLSTLSITQEKPATENNRPTFPD